LRHGKLVKGTQNAENTISWYSVSTWIEKAKKATRQREYDKSFKIIYVWVTNKDISDLPQVVPEEVVLVYRKNIQDYFGPSISSVSTVFDLED